MGLSLPIAIQRLASHHPDAPIDGLVEAYKSSFHVLRNSNLHQEPLYPASATRWTRSPPGRTR